MAADIAVDLPRPREPDFVRRADFATLVEDVSMALSKGMAEARPSLAAQ